MKNLQSRWVEISIGCKQVQSGMQGSDPHQSDSDVNRSLKNRQFQCPFRLMNVAYILIPSGGSAVNPVQKGEKIWGMTIIVGVQ